ncbi:MAG: diguanylate cyclase [Nitrospirae bacterium]|nr:diguanylate cyclase [Nitrospirota bacterium]MBI3350969.1 diguanylate cyclase [Nitrospirota bacterium]
MLNKLTTLIVDKSSSNRKKMMNTLTGRSIAEDFIEAGDGMEALRTVFTQKVDLMICAWKTPNVESVQLLQIIRSHPKLFDIPIVFLTGKKLIKEKIKAYQGGASDFITKPFNSEELVARVNNHLKIRSFQVTLKQKITELEDVSILDPLTGVYNRNYLTLALKREWKRSQRFEGLLGCLMIDLDSFKKINDTFGHKCGDEILKEIAEVISSQVRGYDFSCRYGGDEFIIILANNTREGVKAIAERIKEKVFQHTFLKKRKLNIKISLSIGGTVIEGNKLKNPESLIDLADRALFDAKKAGKDRVIIL